MERQYLPLCKEQHVSRYICMSKECRGDPFVCPSEGCEGCRSQHTKCELESLQTALEAFEAKGRGCKQFQDIINTVIQQLERTIKKLMEQIRYFQGMKDVIGFNERELGLFRRLRERKEREVGVEEIKEVLSKSKSGVSERYEVSPDVIDVISNSLSVKFQEFLRFRMMNQRGISPETLKSTFRVPLGQKEIQKEKQQLKRVLVEEGKEMTFWTFKLDNLKNITLETSLDEIDHLKMVSLTGWSFRKLGLIGRYLPNLKELRVVGCGLDDSDAVMIASSHHLDSLETLNLHQNKITGYGGLRIASAFKKGVNLFLGENLITEDAKKRIMEVMPKTLWVLPWTFNLSY